MGRQANKEPKSDLGKDEFISLLENNCQKMNFQQSMCFQIQNWAVAITVGMLTIFWNIDLQTSKGNQLAYLYYIILHFFLIAILVYLYWQDRDRFHFFIAFRERVKLIEGVIISNDSTENFKDKFFEIIPQNGDNVIKEKVGSKKKGNIIYFSILILFTIISLITIIIKKCVH